MQKTLCFAEQLKPKKPHLHKIPDTAFFSFAIAAAIQHLGPANLHCRKTRQFSLLQICADDYKPAFGFHKSAFVTAILHFAFAS